MDGRVTCVLPEPEFVLTGTKTVNVIPPDMVNASSHEVCIDWCPGKSRWDCLLW
ncbi:hypothetical protein BV22DRAFT_1036522 [Leucogyrophana mollusca]|uniref:Uncharacterized protein n=1 Tax=Leucogyrophana mollusca TaxID=85980 RepID=A0ACB8BEQ8_9AGAM|nr:hypothetical protein BV22DRAFT_1036522 [Leucogyrophana mollusca]